MFFLVNKHIAPGGGFLRGQVALCLSVEDEGSTVDDIHRSSESLAYTPNLTLSKFVDYVVFSFFLSEKHPVRAAELLAGTICFPSKSQTIGV